MPRGQHGGQLAQNVRAEEIPREVDADTCELINRPGRLRASTSLKEIGADVLKDTFAEKKFLTAVENAQKGSDMGGLSWRRCRAPPMARTVWDELWQPWPTPQAGSGRWLWELSRRGSGRSPIRLNQICPASGAPGRAEVRPPPQHRYLVERHGGRVRELFLLSGKKNLKRKFGEDSATSSGAGKGCREAEEEQEASFGGLVREGAEGQEVQEGAPSILRLIELG